MATIQIMSVVGSAVPASLREQGLLACWYLVRNGEAVSGPMPTRASAQALVEQLGKTAIHTQNRPGFIVNRILIPMINEAIFVLQENGDAQAIDASMRLGCNQPIGPLALADLIGLDTVLAILESLQTGFGDPKYRAAPLLREFVAAGFLGKKSGRGFHVYS